MGEIILHDSVSAFKIVSDDIINIRGLDYYVGNDVPDDYTKVIGNSECKHQNDSILDNDTLVHYCINCGAMVDYDYVVARSAIKIVLGVEYHEMISFDLGSTIEGERFKKSLFKTYANCMSEYNKMKPEDRRGLRPFFIFVVEETCRLLIRFKSSMHMSDEIDFSLFELMEVIGNNYSPDPDDAVLDLTGS